MNSTDVIVVGAGPCGALIANRLAAAGVAVTVLEAGKRYGAGDLPNSEANAAKIMWTEPRVYSGKDSVVPKTGVGVGGGTLPWLGVMPRFQRHDFRTMTEDGVGADWPIAYEDLRGHYATVEKEFGIAGNPGPFAVEPYTLPMPPHRMNWHAQLLAEGARKLGAKPFAPPMAINSTNYDGRPACVYCGWCGSGCPTGAKATAENTFLGKAEKLGAKVLDQHFVRKINYENGRATGVTYITADGREGELRAKLVILAAHAIESPRLLLLSANASFPQGLANSSGKVGKALMSHPTWQVFGTFEKPVNAYKGMQMGHVMVQDFLGTDRKRNCARGFILLSYMMPPVTFANLSGGFFGTELKDFLYEYTHTAAWWAHAEGLPSDGNSVSLDADVKDARGLPVARVTYEWTDNDRTLSASARDTAAEMMKASGAKKVRIGLNYGAHAMGTCRMGADPRSSVVNQYCQSHDVPNLFVCDTSVFVTSAGVNPTLTALAIVNRAADYILKSVRGAA